METKNDFYLNFNQFSELRRSANTDKDQALMAAAKQMEGLFMNMMLQSMRKANEVFGEDNMFESRDSRFFRDMYDKQVTTGMSESGGIGLAKVIYRQLSHQQNQHKNLAESGAASSAVNIDSARMLPGLAANSANSIPGNSIPVTSIPVNMDLFSGSQQSVSETNIEPQCLNPEWHTPEDFVKEILPFANEAAKRLQVPAEAIVAQVALETGWGKHVLENEAGNSSFNLFGIKADSRWQGEKVSTQTLEYRSGIAAQETASFRFYASLKNAFEDYVNFLTSNPRYQQIVGKKTDAKQWGYELQQAGYATDPEYGNKIANILDSNTLKQALSQR